MFVKNYFFKFYKKQNLNKILIIQEKNGNMLGESLCVDTAGDWLV